MRCLCAGISDGCIWESGGRFVSRAAWIHQRRTIESFELLIGVEGTAHLEQDGSRYDLVPGSRLLFLPGGSHLGFLPSATSVSFYWFHFLPRGPWTLEDRSQSDRPGPDELAIPVWSPPTPSPRPSILARQLLDFSGASSYSPKQVEYALVSLLMELTNQAFGSGSEAVGGRRIEAMREWIRAHLEEDPSPRSVAEHFRLGPDHVSRLFHERFGFGLKRYIDLARIERAKELLGTSELTVKEIAGRLRFHDEKRMMKLFKEIEGVTATAWRGAWRRLHLNLK